MIAFEVAFLIFLGVVLVVGLRAVGKPIADAYAERMRYKYRDLGSEAQTVLTKKVEYLEAEIMDLKARLKSLEETADYNTKQQGTARGGEVLKLKEKDNA